MYSSIPVPIVDWDKKNLRNAMCFFPFIGVVCGLGLILVTKLSIVLRLNDTMFGILAVLINVIITGGIHIDGFCDTSDAIYSRRSKEEKLRILKDPNCGSFAVLSIIIVMMLNFACYTQIYNNAIILPYLAGSMIISRCLSGISITRFKCTETSSLAKTFGSSAGKNVGYILIAEAIIISLLMIIINPFYGAVVIIVSLIVFIYYKIMSFKLFGGITGDIAGYFLVLSETSSLLALAILGRI